MPTKKNDANLTCFLRNAAPQHHPILYFILGYGRVYVGQSMQGAMRMASSLAERSWGNKFIWIDFNSIAELVSTHREMVEAFLINGLSGSRKWPLSNVQYCKNLGKFENASIPLLGQIVSKIIALINSFEMQNPDERGNYFHDAATFMRGADAVGHDAWFAAIRRMERHNGGASRGAVSIFKLDLATILQREKGHS